MAIADYIIEYKTVSSNEAKVDGVSEKMQSYIDAGTLTVFSNDNSNDRVRVWANQATLDAYNSWFASNAKAEYDAENTANGCVVSKTEFRAS